MILQKKMDAFRYTFSGLKIAWMEEHNFRFQVAWGILTLALAWFFKISPTEFLIVLTMIGFVLATETLNTALEELCDKFQPTHDPHIGKIKDLAAAAVFIAALTAFTVGCIIFVPHFISLL